jgi:hypothetical protein
MALLIASWIVVTLLVIGTGGTAMFIVGVSRLWSNTTVEKYGIAAMLGYFLAAVMTFLVGIAQVVISVCSSIN